MRHRLLDVICGACLVLAFANFFLVADSPADIAVTAVLLVVVPLVAYVAIEVVSHRRR